MPDAVTPGLAALLEHRSWVRDLARRLVRDAADAEDLAQEAWVRAMRSPPDPARDPRPWLRRVLKNLAANRWRGASRRTARETAWRDRRTQKTPAELVADAEQHERLVRRVLELDEPYKTTLVLRFYEGLAPREIAERLQVAEGTVHSRVARAVERLRDELDEEAGGDRKQWVAALLPLARWEGSAPPAAATATTLTGALVMFAKTKLAVASLLALAVVIGGALWLQADTVPALPEGEPIEKADLVSDPTLVGTGTALRAEPTASIAEGAAAAGSVPMLVGRVVDPQGRPVVGAEVFVLPEGVEGVDAEVVQDSQLAFAPTDADGAFCVVPPRGGGRLVAIANGRQPAGLPLAQAAAGGLTDLVLRDARTVTLRVEDPEGRWPAHCRADIDTDPDTTWDRASDPTKIYWWGGIDETDEARAPRQTLRVPTEAPLRVDVVPADGWAALPRDLVLSSEEQEAAFRIVPSGEMTVRVIDGLTGQAPPSDRTVAVTIRERDRDRTVGGYASRNSTVRERRNLSPGHYRIAVAVDGYVPVEVSREIRTPGESLEIEVPLEPRYGADRGRVVLRLTETEPATGAVLALARGGARPPPNGQLAVHLRASGGKQWIDAHPILLPDGRLELRPHLLESEPSGAREGTYDIHVARRGTGTAGSLVGFRVYGGQENEARIPLRPGSLFRVTDLFDAGEPIVDLEIRVPGLGSVPVTHWRAEGSWTLLGPGGAEFLLRQPVQPRVLGPLPADEIEVVLTDADGGQRTVRVRGAQVIR